MFKVSKSIPNSHLLKKDLLEKFFTYFMDYFLGLFQFYLWNGIFKLEL